MLRRDLFVTLAGLVLHGCAIVNWGQIPINSLDTNGDGQISTAEAAGMRLWDDFNENGAIKATDKLIRPKHLANTPMWKGAA